MELATAGLRLQTVDWTASRAQRIFDEIFRSGLPEAPVGRRTTPQQPVLSVDTAGLLEQVKQLESTLGQDDGDRSHVVQMRVNLLYARGVAARLTAVAAEERERYVAELLPALWWIDSRFGYSPFEYLDEALGEADLLLFWRTAMRALIELAHTLDPPRATTAAERLQELWSTRGRATGSNDDEWRLLTRGLMRFVQQPEERQSFVAALLGRCRSAQALSYVASLEPLTSNPRLLAVLIGRSTPQAAMVALTSYLRTSREAPVQRLVRRRLSTLDPPVPSERLASVYGWLDALGDPDPRLSELVLRLAAERLHDESEGRAIIVPALVARGGDEDVFRPERIWGELAARTSGASRALATRRVVGGFEASIVGREPNGAALDTYWCGRMSRALRGACSLDGGTDPEVVGRVMRAVHAAMQSLDRDAPRAAIAHRVPDVARVRSFVELMVLLARRLPTDDQGKALARTLLGSALATAQKREHLMDDMPALMVLDHLGGAVTRVPRINDALSLVAAQPFLERWRAVERGDGDLRRFGLGVEYEAAVVETLDPLEVLPAAVHGELLAQIRPQRLPILMRLRRWLARQLG